MYTMKPGDRIIQAGSRQRADGTVETWPAHLLTVGGRRYNFGKFCSPDSATAERAAKPKRKKRKRRASKAKR